jgi:hypothetical protein
MLMLASLKLITPSVVTTTPSDVDANYVSVFSAAYSLLLMFVLLLVSLQFLVVASVFTAVDVPYVPGFPLFLPFLLLLVCLLLLVSSATIDLLWFLTFLRLLALL